MSKIKIAVIFGGVSSEHHVSLQSASAVIRGLDKEKYELVLLGITRQGKWLLYSGDVEKIEKDCWEHSNLCVPAMLSPDRTIKGIFVMAHNSFNIIHIDVVLPVLHGKNGEDGTLQGLLELSGIPFAGCGTLSSALCMDKDIAHKLVKSAGVAVPHGFVFDSETTMEEREAALSLLTYPLFVKPVKSGSSFGITKVKTQEELHNAFSEAFQQDNRVIVEQSIEGFEVGCAVLGNSCLMVGEIDEIEISDGFFNYEEKYTLKTSKIHLPARIDGEIKKQITDTAKIIYRVLQCRGFARVDLFLTPQNEIIFNEVNTIPGFTAHSRYPSMLEKKGMCFQSVLDEIIGLAVVS